MSITPEFRDLIPLYIANGYITVCYLLHITIYRNHHKNEELRMGHSSFILSLRIREFWYWITSPVFKLFVGLKTSPNMITTLGFLFSVAAALFFANGWIASGGWCVIIGGSMDFFDGRIARHFKIETKSGAFFDAVLDRVSEGVLFLGLMLFYAGSWMFYVTFFAFLFSVLVSYVKAKGETMGIDVRIGIMQRPERIVYIGAPSIAWPMFFPFIHALFPTTRYDLGTMLGLLIIFILGFYTVYVRFERVFSNLRMIESKSSN